MMTSIHYFHMVQVFVSVFIAQYVFKTYYFTFHIAHNAPPIHRNVTLPVGSEGLASSSTFDTTSRASSMDTHSVPASSLPPPQNINHCMNEGMVSVFVLDVLLLQLSQYIPYTDCGATCDGGIHFFSLQSRDKTPTIYNSAIHASSHTESWFIYGNATAIRHVKCIIYGR
eukprot:246408_1